MTQTVREQVPEPGRGGLVPQRQPAPEVTGIAIEKTLQSARRGRRCAAPFGAACEYYLYRSLESTKLFHSIYGIVNWAFRVHQVKWAAERAGIVNTDGHLNKL